MLERLYRWYGKRVVLGTAALIVVLIFTGIFLSRSGSQAIESNTVQLRTVETASVKALSGASTLSVIGTVEAVDEAAVESEVSGRVVSVQVKLGEKVRAGEIIAEIENARERAALLQAEGAYEAAVAAAAQSDVSERDALTSLESARSTGINTYRSAFTVSDDVVRNLVDELFSNPESNIPGFRLDSLGQASFLNNERKALEVILDTWSQSVFSFPSPQEASELLSVAVQNTERIAKYVDIIAQIVSDEDNASAVINGVTIDVFKARFLAARTNLNTTLQSIENAQASIGNAMEALEKAKLGGTSNGISAANAQVKQALGSLRAAEAALADTIIRTPIAGSVNALDVKEGGFVGSRSKIAIIANNNALEITTYIGERDRKQIATGDIVLIEGRLEGRISQIAPAVNPETKKIEVKIQTSATELASGDTVRIDIVGNENAVVENEIIHVPLTAVKLSSDSAFVFTVENGILNAHEVNLGKANGSVVTILDGVTYETEIVVDSRGLNDGVRVNLKN